MGAVVGAVVVAVVVVGAGVMSTHISPPIRRLGELVTGSGLERLTHCLGSALLPQTKMTGDAALAGSRAHASRDKPIQVRFAETTREILYEPAFALDYERREVAFLGQNIGRKYDKAAEVTLGRELRPTEVCMSLDLVCEHKETGDVWVVDWKSAKRVTVAAENMQIRLGIVCALSSAVVKDCNPFGELGSVVGALAYLDNGEVDPHTFTMDDVGPVWDELAGLDKALVSLQESGGFPPMHLGPWCEYCPAMMRCPEHTLLARSFSFDLDRVAGSTAVMSAEEVGACWEKLARFLDLGDAAKKALKLRAEALGGRVPMPGGKKMLRVWRHQKGGPDWKALMGEIKARGIPIPQNSTEVFDSRVVNATSRAALPENGTVPVARGLPDPDWVSEDETSV